MPQPTTSRLGFSCTISYTVCHSLPRGTVCRTFRFYLHYLPNLEAKHPARSKAHFPSSYTLIKRGVRLYDTDLNIHYCTQYNMHGSFSADVAHGEGFSSWPESLHVLSLIPHLILTCRWSRPATEVQNSGKMVAIRTQVTALLSLSVVQNGRAPG